MRVVERVKEERSKHVSLSCSFDYFFINVLRSPFRSGCVFFYRLYIYIYIKGHVYLGLWPLKIVKNRREKKNTTSFFFFFFFIVSKVKDVFFFLFFNTEQLFHNIIFYVQYNYFHTTTKNHYNKTFDFLVISI